MDYKVIYDVAEDAFPIATLLFALIGFAVVVVAGKEIYSIVINKDYVMWDIIFISVLLGFAVLMGYYSYSSYANQEGLYLGANAKRYFEGNYYVTEGVIENFYDDRINERITVNEVDFDYRKDTFIADYFQDRDNLITGNGQKVRVTYVIEGDMIYIVKMEMLETTS